CPAWASAPKERNCCPIAFSQREPRERRNPEAIDLCWRFPPALLAWDEEQRPLPAGSQRQAIDQSKQLLPLLFPLQIWPKHIEHVPRSSFNVSGSSFARCSAG